MEDKNEKYLKSSDLSEENLDYLAKNDIGKDELNSTNKGQDTLFISKKKAEDKIRDEFETKEVSKTDIKEELKTSEDNIKNEFENKEVSKTEIKKELTPALKKKEFDQKNSENKVIKSIPDTNQIPIEKSNQTIKDSLEVKPKIKPKKEIPIEKKPFNEFINEHLIPEIGLLVFLIFITSILFPLILNSLIISGIK